MRRLSEVSSEALILIMLDRSLNLDFIPEGRLVLSFLAICCATNAGYSLTTLGVEHAIRGGLWLPVTVV
jgi:hypothetical protein